MLRIGKKVGIFRKRYNESENKLEIGIIIAARRWSDKYLVKTDDGHVNVYSGQELWTKFRKQDNEEGEECDTK